jgi:hypothetical protein
MTEASGPTEHSEEERKLLDAYRDAEPVDYERRTTGTTVLSVRLARTTLQELTRVARERNRPVGRLARELIEAGLATEESATFGIVLNAAQRFVESGVAPSRNVQHLNVIVHGSLALTATVDGLVAAVEEARTRPMNAEASPNAGPRIGREFARAR